MLHLQNKGSPAQAGLVEGVMEGLEGNGMGEKNTIDGRSLPA